MMILSDDAFRDFWERAAEPLPVLIVGGGRWARTWAGVLVAARGTSQGIVMAARTDPSSLREWKDRHAEMRDIRIVFETKAAFAAGAAAPSHAIVASRPRNHLQDGLDALAGGAHVLMEKPLTPIASAGGLLLDAARTAQRACLAATEFAFLPAFHACAARLTGGRAVTAQLHWDDPRHEERHGSIKHRHDEAGLLVDLLPHAASIFALFSPAALTLRDAKTETGGSQARLTFGDAVGSSFEMVCSSSAPRRSRLLQIEQADLRMSIDFSGVEPSIEVRGEPRRLPTSQFDSTLRLEFGAFLADAELGLADTPPRRLTALQVRLQSQLERLINPDATRSS